MNREKRKRRVEVKPATETLESRWLLHTGFGPWGALRLLDRLEAQGDHRFDALYQQLSAKFDAWAISHPAQAKLFGDIAPAPVRDPAGTATSAHATGAPTHTATAGSSPSAATAPVPGNPGSAQSLAVVSNAASAATPPVAGSESGHDNRWCSDRDNRWFVVQSAAA